MLASCALALLTFFTLTGDMSGVWVALCGGIQDPIMDHGSNEFSIVKDSSNNSGSGGVRGKRERREKQRILKYLREGLMDR